MKLEKKLKKVGISLVVGVSIAMGVISTYSFADGLNRTVGGFRLDGDDTQYIFFGEVPSGDKYLKKAQGKEIMWKVNNNYVDGEKTEDVLRISIRRDKVKNKGSERGISDCFNAKEGGVVLDSNGEIREMKEIINKVKDVKESILEKILKILHIAKDKKVKQKTRRVEYIDIDIPVANIIYKSSGNNKCCEVGSLKALSKLDVSKNKLTILDDDRKEFQVEEDEVIGKPGDVVKLSYHNAILNEDQDKEYISAIIKDTKGDALYYGKISNVLYAEGDVSVQLPNNINAGEYELIVLQEQENGARRTNYAGFDVVRLVIEK